MGNGYGIATEGVAIDPTAIPATGRVWDSILVVEGWGQSGYYTPEALKQAAETGKFPAHTRMFLGHPEDGKEEPAEKTTGVLKEGARFVPSDPEAGGKATLRAATEYFSDRIDWIKERAQAKAIALSIRAPVKFTPGTRDGRFGKIVTEFGPMPALSVDVVARPGAGGSFGVIKESALPEQATQEKEGDDMPLSADELKTIATTVAESLKPTLDGITSALGDVSKVVKESNAPKVLTLSQIDERITKANIGEAGRKRVLTAIEAAGDKADETLVDAQIAREAEIAKESADAIAAALKAHNIVVTESGNPDGGNGEVVTESASVKAWAVKGGE